MENPTRDSEESGVSLRLPLLPPSPRPPCRLIKLSHPIRTGIDHRRLVRSAQGRRGPAGWGPRLRVMDGGTGALPIGRAGGRRWAAMNRATRSKSDPRRPLAWASGSGSRRAQGLVQLPFKALQPPPASFSSLSATSGASPLNINFNVLLFAQTLKQRARLPRPRLNFP